MLNTTPKVSTRIFVGFLITAELKMHLNLSIKWKHANILGKKSKDILQEVHFHGKDFIGLYVPDTKLTVSSLLEYEKNIKQQLHTFCPKVEIENVDSIVFPQVFIA